MTNKIKFVYVAHPYGGKPENKKAVEQIIRGLNSGDHPMLTREIPAFHTTMHPLEQAISKVQADELIHATYQSSIHQLGFMYEDIPYVTGLQKCLAMLSRCDMLLLCGDWKHSKGCMAELGFAMARHIPIIFENKDDYYDLI